MWGEVSVVSPGRPRRALPSPTSARPAAAAGRAKTRRRHPGADAPAPHGGDRALRARGDLFEQVKTVIALGIAVDHPCTEQKPLVLELLVERRLSRAERPDTENGRVAVAVGTLAQVESHRLPRGGQRVPQIETP